MRSFLSLHSSDRLLAFRDVTDDAYERIDHHFDRLVGLRAVVTARAATVQRRDEGM